MGKQKGDPEVASIFSGDCSQREYPVFNIRLILPKVKYFLEITLIVYYYTVFTPFGKLNHLKLNYPKKKIH